MGRSCISEINNGLRSPLNPEHRNLGRGRGDRMLGQNTWRSDVKDIPSPPEPRRDGTSLGLHGERWRGGGSQQQVLPGGAAPRLCPPPPLLRAFLRPYRLFPTTSLLHFERRTSGGELPGPRKEDTRGARPSGEQSRVEREEL